MNRRARVANAVVITHVFFSGENPTDADGDVTVTVSRHDGTALTGAVILANDGSAGSYSFTLAASEHTAQLDELSIVWSAVVGGLETSVTEFVSVVGGHYFSLHQLRGMQGLQNQNRISEPDLQWARDVVEDLIEKYIETSFVRRLGVEIHDGPGGTSLFVNQTPASSLVAITLNGVEQDIANATISETGLIRTGGAFTFACASSGQNVSVSYVWGRTHPPADLERAALRFARHVLLGEETTIPDRARMLQTEIGLFHLDSASEKAPTGLPEVDSVLIRYRRESVVSFA